MANFSRVRVDEAILDNIEQFLDDAENAKADARTYLGLGSLATQDANAVNITGGSISGVSVDLGDTVTTNAATNGNTVQTEDVLLTTGATPAALVDFVMADNTVVVMNATVIVWDAVAGEARSMRLLAHAERGVGAASITIDNRVINDRIDRDLGSNGMIQASVDTGTGAFQIVVTGLAATNLIWRAHTVFTVLEV